MAYLQQFVENGEYYRGFSRFHSIFSHARAPVQMKIVNYSPVSSRSERNSRQMNLENKCPRRNDSEEKFADSIYKNTDASIFIYAID